MSVAVVRTTRTVALTKLSSPASSGTTMLSAKGRLTPLSNGILKVTAYITALFSKTFFRKTVGTAMAQWLRCCATNRKVAGSIPDGVIGIFRCHNPPDRTMTLGSTQPLTDRGTRRIPGGICSRA